MRYDQPKDLMNRTVRQHNTKTFDFPQGYLKNIRS